jgi:hypothetical protein
MSEGESSTRPEEPLQREGRRDDFYCPNCALPVDDPLVCGDCLALICRRCGSPLEKADDLAMG